MSLHAAQQPTWPKSPIPSCGSERSGPAKAPAPATNRVTKPRPTAKWTRGRFSFYKGPASSRFRRQHSHVSTSPDKLLQLAIALPENAIAAPVAVSPSERRQQLTAGKQTTGRDKNMESLSRLQTNGASPQSPNHTLSTSAGEILMADGVGDEPMDTCDSTALNAAAVGAAEMDRVPRSFDYTDLTVLSDDSDGDAAADSPTFKAKEAVMHDLPPAFSEAESFTKVYSCGPAAPTTKIEPLATQTSLRTEFQVTDTGASREIIYIDSSGEESERGYESESNDESEGVVENGQSDESDADYESERNGENENSDESDEYDDNDINDDDACSPIRRLTLAESSFDMPNSRLRAMSISDICAPETTHAAIFVATQNARVETESSEDNVPLAVLRRNRLGNKRKLSDNQATEFVIVNRPTPPPKLSPTKTRQRRVFDSDAFDAAIYSQSDLRTPPGVSVSRPATASSASPHDTRIFVAANPAIHGPVVRSTKWWKDKMREIRDRPKRKMWFGKVTQRMRWLYNKQVAAEAKRQAHVRGAAGRRPRLDPKPAAYMRIMDFGDVPADQLPADVLNTPGWAKACEWQRKVREEDAAMQRQVEHRTQMAWQHFEAVLMETD